ncbi:YitT family protein [Cellulosilyticum sp. WCF-2]|uniref:YitT family protein n=1 Tax=Cellulosilyticum sp. WCF-2 TaxID=2497860 RepID=UPI000F8D9650|nr:YitT family protein [Cellulosilyticum sp. WCF-2]QEH69880.1 YitT family protein [Cellulosilyticum sp. WCF-2]
MNIKKIPIILLGNTLYALAVALFILPNKLITGGTTGLALVFQHQLGIPVSIFVGVFNIVMFVLGGIVLGKSFALTTIISTFYYPFILSIFEKLFGGSGMTNDTMLATIFAGLLIGAGIGMVIRAGASTGGMDIPPLILNKKLKLSVSVTMSIFDCFILLTQMLFSSKEMILYGILLVLLYTMILDKVLMIGKNQMQIKIISERSEAISEMIRTRLDRGTTLLYSEGGHTRKKSYAVLTIVSNRELSKINDLTMEIDPKAFMIINKVNEVRGRGFTLHKEYV